MSIYDDGVVIDQRVRTYMDGHPTVSYREALRALLRSEKAEERASRKEFERRVTHEVDSGFEYSLAAERVLRRDPQAMASGYADLTDQTASADRVGQIMAAAKKASSAAGISMADAVLTILESDRAASQKVAGDWLNAKAMTAINNENLGSSVDRAFPIALGIIRRTYPEVDRQYQTGAVSLISMKTIFRPWFKN